MPRTQADDDLEFIWHMEGEHEREIAGPISMSDVRLMHRDMHERRDDWGHYHAAGKIVYDA